MEDKEFGKLVDEVVHDLPEEFKEKLDNVEVLIEDMHAMGPSLLGLYEGIPHTKRRSYGIGGPLPDRITIFKIPLLMRVRTLDQLKKSIKSTVMHEIGHHFGMSEKEIRNAEKARYNR